MSFNLHLFAFREGVASSGNAARTRKFVDQYQFELDKDHSRYTITLADETTVTMYAVGLHSEEKSFEDAMIKLRPHSDLIHEFVFGFAEASGCLIVPPMSPVRTLVPRNDLVSHLPDGFAADFQLEGILTT